MPFRAPRRLLVALTAVVAAAGGLLGASPAVAGTSTGTVVGHAVTTTGGPAAQVPVVLTTVVVQDQPEDPVDRSHVHVYTTETDAAGDWTVPDAQQGRYSVQVAPGTTWMGTAFPPDVAVVAGTTSAPALTAIRLATIHGSVLASESGAPVGGAAIAASAQGGPTEIIGRAVPSNDQNVLAVEDGGFAVHVPPAHIRVEIAAPARFTAVRTVDVGEGEDLDLGAVRLDPSGTVAVRMLGRSGRPIEDGRRSVVVDGCAIPTGPASTCPGVAMAFQPRMFALQLAPGPHVVRYEVDSPVASTVRSVTRRIVVRQGDDVVLAPVRVRADPTSRGTVRTSTYRRGHAVHVRVQTPGCTDGARPHLRTTFVVDGRVVVPTATRWRATNTGTGMELDATLPARWSAHRTLAVRAVLHGTAAYAGVTTKATVLRRSR